MPFLHEFWYSVSFAATLYCHYSFDHLICWNSFLWMLSFLFYWYQHWSFKIWHWRKFHIVTDLLSSFGYHQIISNATRISGESYTLINHTSGICIDSISDNYHHLFIDKNFKKGLKNKKITSSILWKIRSCSKKNCKNKHGIMYFNLMTKHCIAANNFHHTIGQICNSFFSIKDWKI